MEMKSILCCAAASASALLMASDTPEVSNVSMVQASFGRQVTITYELVNAPNGAVVTLDVQTNKTGAVTANDADWVSIGGEAVCNAQGDVWKKVPQGSRTITWRPDKSWEGHKVELSEGGARAVVTAWALDNTPDYMVVDVSDAAQPNTQKYYPAVDFLPGGILGNPDYRTGMLVLRKIMAKDVTWMMDSTTLEGGAARNATREATHQVTLTNNYYFGVFPVTQAQWDLMQPSRLAPSYYKNVVDRAMRPVETVSYNEIRSSANHSANAAYNWPAAPNPNSFLGKLRTKTGIDFDLPSEAQWEFAARAGNGDTKWGDGSGVLNNDADANLNQFGRYMYNGGKVQNGTSYAQPAAMCGATNGTAIVGSYAPNSWGIYDTAGNVWEWCLDWFMESITAYGGNVNINPAAPANTLSGAAGTSRVKRGGSWSNAAGYCRPAFRDADVPTNYSINYGFRVICPVE